LGSADDETYNLKIRIKDSKDNEWLYHMELKETYFAIKDTASNTYFTNNPITFFRERETNTLRETLSNERSLSQGYNNICHALGIADNKPVLDRIMVLSSSLSVFDTVSNF
jgi:phosphomevalonate kinase